MLIVILLIICYNIICPLALVISKYKNTSSYLGTLNFDPRQGISGFEKYKAIQFDFEATSCEIGKYIGPNNDTTNPAIDCLQICNDISGSSIYEYIYFGKPIQLYGRRFFGGYCLPKRIAHCNESLARPIWQNGYHACVPKYPHVVNEYNKILGCNGKIHDLKLKEDYLGIFPTTTIVENIDERLPSGAKRFICAKQKDNLKNDFINHNKDDPFSLIRNPCLSLIEMGNANYAKFENYTCRCTSSYKNLDNDNLKPCTACYTQYDSISKTVLIARNVYSTGFILSGKNPTLWPPGLSTVLTNSGCERAKVHMSTSYSPATLQEF